MLPSFENVSQRSVGLDLIRSFAIIFVLVCHSCLYFCKSPDQGIIFYLVVLGFYGVELFFILSGFLIGRILLDIVRLKPDIRSLFTFLIRRWMRTLPAYYFWLLVFIFGWYYRFGDITMRPLKAILLYYLSFTQNLAWPMVGNYFSVTWSLTIEEWFYLTFSTALILGCKYLGLSRGIKIVLSVFLILPLMLRFNLPANISWDQVMRKVVIYRLDEIALGVSGLLLYQRFPIFRKKAYEIGGVGIILFLVLWLLGSKYLNLLPTFLQQTQRVMIFNISGVIFLLCFPAAIKIKSLPKIIQFIVQNLSNMAYSLYLTHIIILEIIIHFKNQYHWNVDFSLTLFIISLLTASLFSWYIIEKPFLRLRPRQILADKS